MMFGMVGIGLLVLLLVIGLPVLLAAVLISGNMGIFQRSSSSSSVQQPAQPGNFLTIGQNKPVEAVSRYCSHCGAGLQSAWTHCPQCGAPIQT